jgi:hypothetical protein
MSYDNPLHPSLNNPNESPNFVEGIGGTEIKTASTNFMQVVCRNCGKSVGIGVWNFCIDCRCPSVYAASRPINGRNWGTINSTSEHLKGSRVNCKQCQYYQAQQEYPWGGNTPIMTDTPEGGFKANPDKPDEKTQITPDALKGGFKAASGKATFDLLPVDVLRDLVNIYVFMDSDEEEKYYPLMRLLLDFWEHNTRADLEMALYDAFELLREEFIKNDGDDPVGPYTLRRNSYIKALFAIGELYAIGAKKYSSRNWEKGIDYGIVWSAAIRHLLNHIRGEKLDPVDGQLHLTSVVWNIIALLHFTASPEKYSKFDSRNVVIVAENTGQK